MAPPAPTASPSPPPVPSPTRPGLRLLAHRSPAVPSALSAELSDDDLLQLYHYPDDGRRWLRTNFVSSLDGSVQGADGRAGGINTPSDHHVFALHRALADAVLVGAGTARTEGYRAVDLQPWQSEIRRRLGLAPFPALVIISASAALDPQIARPEQGEGGPVMIITTAGHDDADLAPLRAAGVTVVTDGSEIDLGRTLDRLAEEGWSRLLCEGGPRLHRDLLAAGLVDELSLTLAPVVVGGSGLRSTSGPGLPAALDFALSFALLGEDETLFTSYRAT